MILTTDELQEENEAEMYYLLHSIEDQVNQLDRSGADFGVLWCGIVNTYDGIMIRHAACWERGMTWTDVINFLPPETENVFDSVSAYADHH